MPESTDVGGDPVHVPFDFSSRMFALSATTSPLDLTGDLINPGIGDQIDLAQAQVTTLGEGITVAVLDTGVDSSHPYLMGRLLPAYNATNPEAPANDAPDGLTNRAFGHGTMVAGIVATVAPAARILPVRVLDADGQGDVFAVIRGVRYAVANGAKVINLSLGSYYRSPLLEETLARAINSGCVIIAAAGNDNSSLPYFPAALEGVLGVMSVDGAYHKASFSNYGYTISLCAPGVGIRSSFPGGQYASWSGTSFATPVVSGVAALTTAANPTYTNRMVIQKLWQTASSLNRFNPAYPAQMGRGMLNARRAVAR